MSQEVVRPSDALTFPNARLNDEALSLHAKKKDFKISWWTVTSNPDVGTFNSVDVNGNRIVIVAVNDRADVLIEYNDEGDIIALREEAKSFLISTNGGTLLAVRCNMTLGHVGYTTL